MAHTNSSKHNWLQKHIYVCYIVINIHFQIFQKNQKSGSIEHRSLVNNKDKLTPAFKKNLKEKSSKAFNLRKKNLQELYLFCMEENLYICSPKKQLK